MTRILIMRLPFPTKMKKKNRKNVVKGGGGGGVNLKEKYQGIVL